MVARLRLTYNRSLRRKGQRVGPLVVKTSARQAEDVGCIGVGLGHGFDWRAKIFY